MGRREQPDSGAPLERPLDQLDVDRVVFDVQHGSLLRSEGIDRHRLFPLVLDLAELRADRGQQLAGAGGERATIVRSVFEHELEALRERRELVDAQRRGGAVKAVRVVRCRCPVVAKLAPLERVEVALDPEHPFGCVEHEEGEELARFLVVHATQRMPSSCAAATASARRDTPSLS